VNLLITGASRGLGNTLARGLPRSNDTAYLISRSRPSSLEVEDGARRVWLQVDLSRDDAPDIIAAGVSSDALDAVIHNAGIWEPSAFSSQYDFVRVSDAQTRDILRVNLESAITLTRALLPKLERSSNPKIVLVGSVNGLENTDMPEVAYNASKWGLRGVAHGLRAHLRTKRIGVTVINPGSIDTDDDSSRQDLIPPSDLLEVVRLVLRLSRRSNLKEVHLPAMLDEMA
jgi:NAD(P)-dependent dehydrogenase (short-subunit alcohol dehydrogenase family)